MARKKTAAPTEDTQAAAAAPASDGFVQDGAQHEAPGGAPGLRIVAQYVRDSSFENPRAPASLIGDVSSLKIDRHIELNARGREDGLFEVDLKLVASATRDGETVFLAEVVYGGLFGIDNVPMDDIQAILAVECPRFLFPFARRVISDMISDGGYPPFRIDPIDFGQIYMQRQAQLAAQGDGGHSLNG